MQAHTEGDTPRTATVELIVRKRRRRCHILSGHCGRGRGRWTLQWNESASSGGAAQSAGTWRSRTMRCRSCEGRGGGQCERGVAWRVQGGGEDGEDGVLRDERRTACAASDGDVGGREMGWRALAGGLNEGSGTLRSREPVPLRRLRSGNGQNIEVNKLPHRDFERYLLGSCYLNRRQRRRRQNVTTPAVQYASWAHSASIESREHD
ncbi:hypothetical protein C8J57DRAFT_1237715 [Mycena rebaudengoi]|nr:hypothetical protein C8J57DRAFT_1237715 [Mycena rebaudengoi]